MSYNSEREARAAVLADNPPPATPNARQAQTLRDVAAAKLAASVETPVEAPESNAGEPTPLDLATPTQQAEIVRDALAKNAGFVDPTDAAVIDVEAFVTDGQVDKEGIFDAVAALLAAKPHYGMPVTNPHAVNPAQGGSAEALHHGEQVKRDDVKGMSREEILAAQADGRFDDLMKGRG